ncbi:MAG: rhodanese-like domain-containing protein [Myxococcota bacterium]|nr:rhodanese-like domain-containing protein [Myxococcota bacterium]
MWKMLGVLVAAGLLSTTVHAGKPVPATDIRTVEKALQVQSTPLIVDVRSVEEFKSGHIPQAINIPLAELDKKLVELSPHRNSTIYLVCEVGRRSEAATQQLLNAGFIGPVNVTGGTRAWREAKLPLER